MTKVPFLGKIPIDPHVGTLNEKGKSILVTSPHSQMAEAFKELVQKLIKS